MQSILTLGFNSSIIRKPRPHLGLGPSVLRVLAQDSTCSTSSLAEHAREVGNKYFKATFNSLGTGGLHSFGGRFRSVGLGLFGLYGSRIEIGAS